MSKILNDASSETPRPPQLLYGQNDPANWDPFSRANRIALVHDYCTHATTNDINLRRALDFMERKVSMAREQRAEGELKKDRDFNERSLFNYKFHKARNEDYVSSTDTETLHSHIAEYLINCIQISEIAQSRGFRSASYRCRYYRAKLALGGWIEDNFLESTSETKNTFFLLSRLEQGLDKIREQENEVPHWRLPKKLSRDTLDETFRELQSRSLFDFSSIMPAKMRGKQTELELVHSTREVFYSISHEIMENAMSHGVESTINPHAAKSGSDSFGKVFFLQTSTEIYSRNKVATQEFPDGFEQFHLEASGRLGRGRQKYRVVTYFDTGLGVERHLEKYGDVEGKVSIAEISKRFLSARPTEGSGHGFEKMKSFAEGLGAFLAVATADGTYSYDGLNKKEVESQTGHLQRGTVVAVFLPER